MDEVEGTIVLSAPRTMEQDHAVDHCLQRFLPQYAPDGPAICR